jgi:hypothetical protein
MSGERQCTLAAALTMSEVRRRHAGCASDPQHPQLSDGRTADAPRHLQGPLACNRVAMGGGRWKARNLTRIDEQLQKTQKIAK